MTGKENTPEDPNSEYLGNIWGWKFSFISLIVILFFLALVAFRWFQLGKPSMRGVPATEEPAQDTLSNPDSYRGQ